jgi:hypothetical protein
VSAFREACDARGLIPFEEYLRRAFAKNVIDHALRVSRCDDAQLAFYIHPAKVDGDTFAFLVEGNRLARCDGNGVRL